MGGGRTPNNYAVTSQKRLARHCGLVDSHFFLSEVLNGTQCIQTPQRKALLALAGFNNFAQVREYTAVCSYIPTSKYRGKPLALCKTLVARTCSLEAAHSFLSDAVLNFCSTMHRVRYTAGLYTPYCVTTRARSAPPQFLTSSVCLCFVHCCSTFALLTSTLYYMLHYTARAPYCVATHALPPVSEVSQFRFSVVFFSWP